MLNHDEIVCYKMSLFDKSFQPFVHLKSIDCNQGAVRSVRYNVDGCYALSCGSDKKVKLWNPDTGLLLKTYGGHADEVTDVAGSCDSCHIVTASLDKSIIYWDVATGQQLRRLRVHAGGVKCVRFNEDSSVAFSGSRDNTVMCWDIRTRKLEPVQTMKEAKDCITSIVVDDHKVIASSLDGCIRYYDIRSGEMVCDDLGVAVTYMVQTKKSNCIVAACQDGTVRLLDNNDGTLLSEYENENPEQYQIECGIMANDLHIVSGSSKGHAIVWDLLEGKVLQNVPISSHGGVVHSLSTHPSKNKLLFARKRDMYVFSSEGEQTDGVIL